MSTGYSAVRHLLTEPRIAARTAAFIRDDGFDFAGLEQAAETLSGGERLLIRIAEELWSGEKRAGLWELVRQLDRDNFGRVLETLAIANGQMAA
jgi:excinuclease UvrABC ATPase subunit